MSDRLRASREITFVGDVNQWLAEEIYAGHVLWAGWFATEAEAVAWVGPPPCADCGAMEPPHANTCRFTRSLRDFEARPEGMQ